MNINDVFNDGAGLQYFVLPLCDNILQRQYPESITNRAKLIKAETEKLLADLNGVVKQEQNPAVPGLPGMAMGPPE
ncbi:MAG: hypothetical protein WC869_00255 [Phycisphaerae bacterium]|jgi:hypothetical protein